MKSIIEIKNAAGQIVGKIDLLHAKPIITGDVKTIKLLGFSPKFRD